METKSVTTRLRRLRGWFLVWFVVQSIIGTLTAVRVVDTLRASACLGPLMGSSPRGLDLASSVVVEAMLLGLGLWVFHGLLQRRPWARLTLLVVAWISVVGAVPSLLSMTGLGAARAWLPDMHLGGLAAIGLVTNALNLVFWGYAIRTLQSAPDVRDAFVETPAAA
jgi:hypothetical protein